MRGATTEQLCFILGLGISIHAPLAGCDICSLPLPPKIMYFNPRTPCGVRPKLDDAYLVLVIISIHAPLAGCDAKIRTTFVATAYFNPRTPCGVRHMIKYINRETGRFQSTHPLRGATSSAQQNSIFICSFQSTHPLRGATHLLVGARLALKNFNPRTPCGVRLPSFPITYFLQTFQSTHPLRGATKVARALAVHVDYFNPRTPCGVRRCSQKKSGAAERISIHAPLAGCD